MRLALAISTFRQDERTIQLIEKVLGECADLFERIYVVDSMGSGALAAYLDAKKVPALYYENASTNLGSAGNWAHRLTLAARDGLDWCFTVNHDGEVPRDTILRFIEAARQAESEGRRVGALYPLRYVPHRRSYDFTGTQKYSLPYRGLASVPQGECTKVYWGSSNGSFYNLQPVREGLLPWADLWMGWEDLGYGWLLQRYDWEQFIIHDAPLVDAREYLDLKSLGVSFTSSDKPAWYAYYSARNWLLVAQRNHRPLAEYGVIGARLFVEAGVAGGFKAKGVTRLRYMARGVLDAVRGRAGKWIVP